MIRDPRAVFDQLFGVGATQSARRTRRRDDRSILDWVTDSVNELKRELAPPIARAWPTTWTTCARSSGGFRRSKSQHQRRAPRAADAPVGVPDSFEEHVKLMFDLQAVALRL